MPVLAPLVWLVLFLPYAEVMAFLRTGSKLEIEFEVWPSVAVENLLEPEGFRKLVYVVNPNRLTRFVATSFLRVVVEYLRAS